MKNYYQILGVKKEASVDEINEAYIKLSNDFHPGASGENKDFEERINEIKAAYGVLSDPEKRASYDTQFGYKELPPTDQTVTPISADSNIILLVIVAAILVVGVIIVLIRNADINQNVREKPVAQRDYTPVEVEPEIIVAPEIPDTGKNDTGKRVEGLVLSSLTGTWVGRGHQDDINQDWDIKLICNKGKFKVEYPSAGCGGEWLVTESAGSQISFHEQLSYGEGVCNDNGTMIVELDSKDKLKFSYYFPDVNTLNAQGTLHREH